MTLFGNLTNDGLEETQDRIGGNPVRDADAYKGKIKLAYAGKASSSNAQSVTIVLAIDAAQGGGEYRETFWITNKDGQNYFMKDGKKNPLPGFTVIDDICLVTTNKPLSQQAGEEKVINLYDFDQKKEVPTSVPVLVELLDKEVIFGIQRHRKNKEAKNSAGVYEPTAEEREENVTDKIFHFPSQLTVVEARNGTQTAKFYGIWVEKNRGQVQDRRKVKDGASAQTGRSGPPKAGEATGATKSLF